MTTAVQAIGLGKRYRRAWALRDCTVAIPEGRVVALVGPNGAGKSTLLHLATGLLTPTTGEVRVFGAPPAGGPEALARVGFLAQDKPLYQSFTVAEMLRFGGRLASAAAGHGRRHRPAGRGRFDPCGQRLASHRVRPRHRPGCLRRRRRRLPGPGRGLHQPLRLVA